MFNLRINTSAQAVNQTFALSGGGAGSRSRSARWPIPRSLSGTGVTLTIGNTNLTANVAFEQVTNLAGQKRVRGRREQRYSASAMA